MSNIFEGWRVLAVDDEPDNLNLLGDLLEFQGAIVSRADGAERGIAAVDEFKPSVILLDLSMPGMDGWEMHRRLRAREALTHVPIIAITALAMPADVERAKAAGFDGFITKPFRIQTLLTELKDSVDLFSKQRGDGASQSERATNV